MKNNKIIYLNELKKIYVGTDDLLYVVEKFTLPHGFYPYVKEKELARGMFFAQYSTISLLRTCNKGYFNGVYTKFFIN